MRKDKEIGKKKKSVKRIILKIILVILISILIFMITVVATAFFFIRGKWNKTNYVDLKSSEITINTNVSENLSDYLNIALLGVDSRADSYTNCRSDCIMIISINQKTHDVKLCSVYRDTYLDIEGYGLDKVTHAYAFGNAKLSLNTLNRNLDLNITKFAAVNFETVKKVVNSMGGVNIYIAPNEVQFITGINSPGTYKLNGEQALQYSRIRYTTGGDYVRTERMRTVLTAVFNDAKKRNIGELNNLIDVILPDVYTNISSYEIFNLLPTIASFNIIDDSGWPADVRGTKINGIFYSIPVDLEKQVSLLHKYLFDKDNYVPSDTVKEISSKMPRF